MKWNYNRQIGEINEEIRELRELRESNKEMNRKYEEVKENIRLIGNETKETKKKRRIAIGLIIWLVISAYMTFTVI